MPLARESEPQEGRGPFIPQEDIVQVLADGRTIQIATKGTPVPYSRAVELGLIKVASAPGPSEVKVDGGEDRTLRRRAAARPARPGPAHLAPAAPAGAPVLETVRAIPDATGAIVATVTAEGDPPTVAEIHELTDSPTPARTTK